MVKQPPRRKWSPSVAMEFKANFDGAWAGIRVVVRDSSGQVLAALAEKIKSLIPSTVWR